MQVIQKIKGEVQGKRVVGLIGREFAVEPFYVGVSMLLGRGKQQVLCTGSFKTLEQAKAFAAKWGLQ